MDLKSREPRAVPMNRPAEIIFGGLKFAVRPEHIHLALREFAKIENHPFSQRFPLQVPINEKLHGFWS